MNAPRSDHNARATLRIAVIRDEISARLWSVNQGMRSEVYNALMDQMALLQFRFEQSAADGLLESDRRLGPPERRTVAGTLPPSRLAVPADLPRDDKPH